MLFTVCLLATGGEWSTNGLPDGIGLVVIIAIVVIGAATAVVVRVPKFRRAVIPSSARRGPRSRGWRDHRGAPY
jgi:hypothetical protein